MAATRLRVVTWNIRAAIGPGPFPDRWWRRIDADRLRAIGVFLSSLDADIVALQEVALVSRDGALLDNAGDLGRQLGKEVRYAAVRSFDVLEDLVTAFPGEDTLRDAGPLLRRCTRRAVGQWRSARPGPGSPG